MRPIPLSIKIEIFRKYLEGFSMPEISKLYNVSVGSIHSITTEESKMKLLTILER
jgi:DNA-directed RNA polymerase specialized sigma24 family protein